MLNKLPQHIAIIMDGNGRWAQKRLLPKELGHKKGADTAIEIAKIAKQMGIKYLTLYTFSTENWQRDPQEVQYLLNLLKSKLRDNLEELLAERIRIKFIGDLSRFHEELRTLMHTAEEKSQQHNSNTTLMIAVSYSSKDEIRHAACSFAQHIVKEGLEINNLDSNAFDQFFPNAAIPDPDLLIRTSGEKRLSNFMLWQLSYTELYFIDTLWPDFTEKDLREAIIDFNRRERRYGKRNN